jgi:hypothetical protein
MMCYIAYVFSNMRIYGISFLSDVSTWLNLSAIIVTHHLSSHVFFKFKLSRS